MKDPAERQRNWLAIGVLLLGAVYTMVGVGLLLPGPRQVIVAWIATPTMAQGATAVLARAPNQTATAVPAWTSFPTLTLSPSPVSLPTLVMLPTWSLAPTPVSLPTLSVLPTLALFPTPVPLATPGKLPTATDAAGSSSIPPAQPRDLLEGAAFSLTIVHTNDTWGYTRPCG